MVVGDTKEYSSNESSSSSGIQAVRDDSNKPLGKQELEKGSSARNNRLDSKTKNAKLGSAVSFPVRRSGLATKRLDTPRTFDRKENSTVRPFTDRRNSLTEFTSRIEESSPKKSNREDKPKSASRSRSSSRGSSSNIDHSNEGVTDARLRESCGEVDIRRHQRRRHAHHKRVCSESHEAAQATEEEYKDASRPFCSTDPVSTLKGKHFRDESLPSSIQEQVSVSGSLVAYNSSDEERTRTQPRRSPNQDHTDHHDKRSNLDHQGRCLTYHPQSRPDTHESHNTRLESEVKVVKTTAKSGWDSSDSDFETTATSQADQYSAHSEHSASIPASTDLTSSASERPKKERNVSKTRRRLKERSPSNKSAEPEKEKSHLSESGRRLSSPDKAVRSKRRKRDNSQQHRDRSNSSQDSRRSNSEAEAVVASRHGNSVLSDDNRHARSSSQLSSHSSQSGSRFSSASSTSSHWRSSHRHSRHSHRRRRSKSYTSDSSSGASSHASRFAYRDRSKSTSRRSRRRRRRTRSYHRHYRRRSYSSSSRSRSRSWISSDTSSRSSYQSSRSSASRASANSRRRSSTTHRTPSPQVPVRRKPTSSTRTPGSNESRRTDSPEHRSARAVSSSNTRNKAPEPSRSSTNSITSAFTFGSLSNVADTVSAAVKRVTGGNSANNRYRKLSGNKSPHRPVALPKSSDDDSPHQQPTTTSSGTLVDIPLPKDSTRHESARQSEPVPYIGPQLPPELAERFGLSIENGFSNAPTSETSEQNQSVTEQLQADTDKEVKETPSSTSSSITQNSHSSSLNLSIPPEQVEQYRALQEQAKQHALRRTNLLASGSAETLVHNTDYDAHLALFQQLGQSAPLLPSSSAASNTNVLLPALSSTGFVLTSLPAPTTNASNSAAAVESWANQHLAQLPYDRQMSLISAHQANALSSQIQRQQFISSVAQVSAPQLMARTVATTAPIPTAVTASKPSVYETATLPTVLIPTQLSQHLQQAQLQQVLQAAAAVQAAQANSAAAIQAQASQPALTFQLLQQLGSGQQSQKSPVMGVSPNTVTTSILAAQQQKLLTQLQRQVLGNATVDSLSRSSVEELIPAIGSLPPDTDPNSILVADRVSSASALTAALLRARATNASVPGLSVTGMSVNPTQSSASQLVALLTAAQQQQQQQQNLSSSIRLSTSSNQPAVASLFPQDANAVAVNRLIAAYQLQQQHQQQQQQSQLLLLHALNAQQRRVQQQGALNPTAIVDQSQLSIAAALQQRQLAQIQLQQQQQQALATAIATVHAQRQQQSQDRSNKPTV